jgi:hypothetical protein
MINVNKITSTLAKLPDQQLQQYAQMHKSDPYIMALAMSESNRRKEMRAAGQGGQGMQEQPKVVDQMVAEMAPQQMPEDQGIGQLPAGEMNFAGGGIIAFADGGDVERYSGAQGSFTGGNIFTQMDQQKAAQLAQLNSQLAMIEPQLRAAAASGDQQAIQTYAQQAQAIRGQINAVREAAGNRIGLIESPSAPPAAPPARAVPTMPTGQFNRMAGAEQLNLPAAAAAKPAPTFAPEVSREMLNRVEQPARLNATVYGEPIKTEDKGKGKDKTDRGAPTDRAATAPKEDPFSMESILRAQEQAMRGVNYQQGALRNQAVGLGNLYETQAEERLTKRKKEIEEEGDIYKGREDRLKTREADIGKQKDQNTGLAFLNAGLAIMSTPGGLSTAIGKGAQVGTAQYASGLKDLRTAQQKLDDARDNIEELRLNRKDMNNKEIRALEKERNDNINKGKELLFGVAKDQLGVDEKGATELFKTYMGGQKTVFEQKEQTKRSDKSNAAMAANRPYDIQGELAKAVLAGDKPRVAKLKEALTTVSEARKPGLDMELVKKFENLPGVKNMQIMLNGLRMQTDPNPKTLERIRQLEGQLAATATQNGIDPAKIGVTGSASASPTGGRSINFNDIP